VSAPAGGAGLIHAVYRHLYEIHPQPWLDCLAATVVLRRIIALADQAPELSDEQLRSGLLELTGLVR
jgi:hypothetical protein